MWVFTKLVAKNIRDKKFRSFLIIISIAISSGLFFASNAISNTVEKLYVGQMQRYFGTAEIAVRGGGNSSSRFIYTNDAEQYKSKMEYMIGAVQGYGAYTSDSNEKIKLELLGINVEDLQKMNPVEFQNIGNLKPFTGKKIIISSSAAEKYGLKPGDSINLEIRGVKHKFYIAATAYPSGPFLEDGQTTFGVVPIETLSTLYSSRGRVSVIYMKLKNPAEKQDMIYALAKTNNQYIVKETVNAGELKRMVSQITTPFSLMVIMVLFTSMFIIYSAFKVISIERLPVIGTLRSIGARKSTTGAMLFLESLFYGLIGGVLGSAGGIGVLHVMTAVLSRAYMNGAKADVVFTHEQLIAAFIMAVGISVLSSALPIMQISRIPVKEVILNTYSSHDGSDKKSLFLGLIFLTFSITIPRFFSGKYGIIFYSTCIILSIIALIMLIPYITGGLAYIFENIFEKLYFNVGAMAVKNVKGNKSMLNNISLLAIGIATLLMINTISFSLMEDITSLFRGSKFDVIMWWVTKGDRNMEMILNRIDGVDSAYGVYQLSQVEVDGLGVKFQQIDGVDRLKYLDYMQLDSEDNPGRLLQGMDSGRNILITYMMKEKLGVKRGDNIRLQMKNGTKEYKVAGFFNSIIAGGSYGLVPERYAKLDGGEQYYSSIYIKTYKNPDEVVNSIKGELKKASFRIGTLTDVESDNKKSSLQMFSILKGFSVIAFTVGIIGVINNFIISFMQRKRYLALLSSVGMSKVQTILMIFVEGIVGGFIGGTTGVISGILITSVIPKVMQVLNVGIEIKYSTAMLFSSIFSGVLIMLGASISSAVKSFRLNVVEAIKYE